jgi:hypothetical protein
MLRLYLRDTRIFDPYGKIAIHPTPMRRRAAWDESSIAHPRSGPIRSGRNAISGLAPCGPRFSGQRRDEALSTGPTYLGTRGRSAIAQSSPLEGGDIAVEVARPFQGHLRPRRRDGSVGHEAKEISERQPSFRPPRAGRRLHSRTQPRRGRRSA